MFSVMNMEDEGEFKRSECSLHMILSSKLSHLSLEEFATDIPPCSLAIQFFQCWMVS